MMAAAAKLEVRVGQTWERADGSRFKIEHVNAFYATYWLAAGSRPQYRSIRLERLTGAARNYRIVGKKP